MEKEAEEKEHEEKVKEFKKAKRQAKRKTGEEPEGWKNPKKRKVEETPAGYDPDGGETSSTNSFSVHLDGKQDEAEDNLTNDGVGGEASPHNSSYKIDTAGEKVEEDPP
jgi:hypothetical protein